MSRVWREIFKENLHANTLVYSSWFKFSFICKHCEIRFTHTSDINYHMEMQCTGQFLQNFTMQAYALTFLHKSQEAHDKLNGYMRVMRMFDFCKLGCCICVHTECRAWIHQQDFPCLCNGILNTAARPCYISYREKVAKFKWLIFICQVYPKITILDILCITIFDFYLMCWVIAEFRL